MTDSHETRVKAIFQRALEVDAPARAEFLQRVCEGEEAIRGRVEALLSAYDEAGAFLAEPEDGDAPAAEAEDGVGAVIDRYKLLQRVGEGGFGTVFMAEQVAPVRRRVALKVIKHGMDTKEVIARFEAERQALAMMDHPNIAKVFDAGATPNGRPYFVMELVRGTSITEYCDQAGLDTAQRLDLFRTVCDAIQHAHQKGVIHRDIKPSNVLVTLHDGAPVPKVIDFGIAKATDHRLTERTLFTELHQFMGTPEYMAPEQAELSGLDVDTRADVYSLGVLLYELLTGTKPFELKTLLKEGFGAVLQHIREVDPPKPSSRVSTMAEDHLGTVARQRGATPVTLGKIIRGDLDWIVMKALEKDRTRRYETAAALAQDIGRYQEDEPVLARSPSAGYRLRKYVRRHRVAVGTMLAVVVALGIGAILAVRGYVEADAQLGRALRAETAARREARDAKEERTKAVAAQERADRETAEAKDQRANAVAEKERADREAAEAKDQRAKAVAEKERADREASKAQRHRAEADRRFAIMSKLMAAYHEELRDNPRERWSGAFLAGMQAALEAGDPGDIFFFLEYARIDQLLDLMGSKDQLATAQLPKSLQTAEAAARVRVLEARRAYQMAVRQKVLKLKEVRIARAALNEANERLVVAVLQGQRVARAVAAASPVLPAKLQEVQEHLRRDQGYLAYALLPTRVIGFLVTADAARSIDLGPVEPLQQAAAALNVDDGSQDPAAAIEVLRGLLITRLSLPEGVRQLLISPEGSLLAVPFGLLLPDREVALTPSASTYLSLLESAQAAGKGVVAVGDVSYGRTGARLTRLPATRQEAMAIGSVVLLGEQATEGNFRAALPEEGRLRGVHLACHGFLDNQRPLLSALVLSADLEDDGYLTALDVSQLRIEADMVSLSACETGRGAILQGGGIGSLTRAFLYAGASRLLVSQVKVDDEATVALMIKFYEHWNPKDGGKRLGAVAALKAAQAHVRSQEKWKHPRFWAPWTIWGLAE